MAKALIFMKLEEYVESRILPMYDGFDPAHRRQHVLTVISQAMELASHYDVDPDMVYAAAAYHDTGLSEDRKTHHLVSGRIIRGDRQLRRWFSEEQVETIAQAAEDHRASSDHEPRSIYGRIVAEADRQIIPRTVILRTVQYGFSHYPGLDREGHWQRTLEHLQEKYAEGGYLKLWIPESPNAARLAELRALIRDRKALRALFDEFYDNMSKEQKYTELAAQAGALIAGETDMVAAMANLSSLIHGAFGFWWTGFYRVSGEQLVLGPFQGPVACTRIPFGKGVCGSAWKAAETIIVPDVEQFPGHIACSSESRSEIVVPVKRGDNVIAVLDIDSAALGTFDGTDGKYLEQICDAIALVGTRTIHLAGGCFWGTEHYIRMVRGVVSTETGFANGRGENPSYKEVYTDTTGFAETVKVVYDPSVLSLEVLLELFFKAIDPLSLNRQGEDVGTRYRTGIYYSDPADLPAIEKVYSAVQERLGQPLAVELLPLENYYPAEEYHQDYLLKHPDGYCHLRPELFEFARNANR
ncbi:MAG: peptide-methionine (S)-S-oxide reductase MsrA [Bacteroidales bacterium]|nr:peptide-methionine (S)-S-oxide reductase MsrA [Bacteroidales bacterium]